MKVDFGLYQVFNILLACVSPCIWGGAMVVLYPFRQLTSYSWMVFAAAGLLFLIGAASACLSVSQLTGIPKPQDHMNLLYFWQGFSLVGRVATGLLAVGIWLSFRDLRDRLEMLTDIVEGRDGELPAGDFGRGY
jgi:hypothetical protein